MATIFPGLMTVVALARVDQGACGRRGCAWDFPRADSKARSNALFVALLVVLGRLTHWPELSLAAVRWIGP